MKIILATDPMFRPLTGIGKYTYELVKNLGSEPRVTDVRFFNMGHWQESDAFVNFENKSNDEPTKPEVNINIFGHLRKLLANNKLTTKAYSIVTPFIYAPYINYYITFSYTNLNFLLFIFLSSQPIL